jgi:outer membrane scaffolding protein for murein synthesis (MipA/OmpV family)
MGKRSSIACVVSAVATVLAGANARASDLADTTAADAKTPGWILTIGGGPEYGPAFEGASSHSFTFVPSFDLRRAGEKADYSAPDDNIDYSLFTLGGVEFGPVVGIRSGRSQSDTSGALTNVHTIDWSVDAGGYMQYWPIEDQLRLRLEARQGLRKNDGFVTDLAADWFQPFGDDLVISAGPRASFADTTYMRNSFGISATESASSGLSSFNPSTDFKSVGFVVGVTYQISDTTSLQLYNKFDRLVGDAANSPIVRDAGSPNQNTVGIVLTRSFGINF